VEALLLGLLLAAATWVCGWWGVPLGSAIWAVVRDGHRAWIAGLAGGLAWGGLLLTLPLAPLHRTADRLGAVFNLPAAAPLAVTVLYAALLGWSAARLASALRR
jgi:hypothetical protein